MELIQETIMSENLNTSFHYDHIFGTVINRFMVQASIGKLYCLRSRRTNKNILNINDTLQCVELAVKNPAKK